MDAREKLFKYNKIYDHKGSEGLFVDAMRESVLHHQKSCSFYSKLLASRDFNPESIKTIESTYEIPAIPVDFLKYHQVLSVDESLVTVHATSSGTLGQKSQVFLDESTLKLGTKMAIKAMKYHGFISLIPTNYLLLGYEPKEGNDMGNVKVLLGMQKLAPAKETVFALRNAGDQYQIDYVMK